MDGVHKKSATNFWFNVRGRSKMPFQVIIGGRGTGKSYSALDLARNNFYNGGRRFLYVRRERVEIDACCTPMGNPFKKLNNDKGYEVDAEIDGKSGVGFFSEKGIIIGYAVALSSFAGLRSVDMSDVDLIIFDEFIPEKHKRKIRNEGQAVFNLYETVNRNREIVTEAEAEAGIKPQPPCTMILLANALSLNNPILLQFDVVGEIQKMIQSHETRRTIKERRLYIEMVNNVGVTDAKRNTALYMLANAQFVEETLSSDFKADDMSSVVSNIDMRHYKPYYSLGHWGVYYSRNNDTYYIGTARGSFPRTFYETQADRVRLFYAPSYRLARGMGRIFFDSFETQVFFDDLMNWL